MIVFLSHNHRDEPLADEITARLEAKGIEVWDDESVAVGDHWSEAIAAAVDRADAFLLLISKDFLASEWALLEVGAAVSQNANHGRPVIPVVVDANAVLPALLRDLRYVDLSKPETHEEEFDSLVEAVVRADRKPQPLRGSAREELVASASHLLEQEWASQQMKSELREYTYARFLRTATVVTAALTLIAIIAVVPRDAALALTAGATFTAAGLGFFLGREAGVKHDERY